ncbi:glycosyltransferase [Leeuwenhoekiella sp. H156]|uniref:glycosyltransferase n=1 Tax=Leeuwenhoekiella sp. H156 TaxID=3450128 RepID=UPI003FA4C127
MTILHVLKSIDPETGGVAKAVLISVEALSRLNISSEVVSFDYPDQSFVKESKIKIHALGRSDNLYAYSKKYRPWAREHFASFDVVIIHGLWQYSSYGTYKFWREFVKNKNRSTQLWVMPHGMLDPYFQKAKSRRFKALRNWVFWNILEKNVVNYSTGLLFTCQQEKVLAKHTFNHYIPQREENIGFGVEPPPNCDFNWINDFKLKFGINNSYILFLSRIDEKKGVDLLVKAYNEIQNPEKPDLVIAGPGINSKYGQIIKGLAKSNERIHFTDMLVGKLKWGAFYGCEAFALSSHQENFGIVVAEALACSKPVLISNQVNIFREIELGNAGLIAPDTIEGTKTLLEKWNSFPNEEKIYLGDNARKVYLEKFTPGSFAHTMKEVFKKDN